MRELHNKQALDKVMELAVELPTYQRNDLNAYNTNVIDVDTLTPADELSPYNGPMSRLWDVGLKEGAVNGAGGNIFFIIISVVVLAAVVVTVLVVSKKKKAAKATANGMYKFDDDEDAEDNGTDSDSKKE
ncbi:MAG: hypothetical protein IJF55_00650 [Clostridia bacterium]|nr:hypothetical protein [Clostridia bacterium]